jgi:choline-sulfatase
MTTSRSRTGRPYRPNILVIMSDQHTPDVLGAYGNADVRTPNLDRLAAAGIAFRNAYCNNPICVASRMSFLTGQTTQQIEVWSLSDGLRSDELTWPTLLGAAGYETVMSGRMHMWWPDKHLGFQRRLCGDTKTSIANGTFGSMSPAPNARRNSTGSR